MKRVDSAPPGRVLRGPRERRGGPPGSHRWSSGASGQGEKRRGDRRAGLEGQRAGLHRPAAPRPPGSGRSPRPSVSRGCDPGLEAWEDCRGAGGLRGASPGHLAGVPATRAGTRLCRPVRTERGATPGGGSGARAGGKLVPWSSGLRCSAHGPPPVRSVLARVASQGLPAPGGRRCGGGRLARRWRERPGGRGWVRRSLLHSQPVRQAQALADEAGNFPT